MSDPNPKMTDPDREPDAEGRAAAEGADASTASLRSQLDEAARQRDEYLEQLRRSQAEFVNFQKRSRSQAEADRTYAVSPLANDLLSVIDNFERAIDAARQSGNEAIITGLEIVHRQLLEALAKHGVEPIESIGQPFDPNIHEALMQQPDADHPEGTVVAELSRGFRIRDRVLRPSRVAVSVSP
ncbi:nucleotide exchange factor GrpE [Tautonia plasticadhaerens]|uniref:Protein GrpE n=1 Tax=Tautonia plasticadhaerens TaxID=2527974 RepID=A0A518GYG3_9BACT|nr:nucleotide exchange factor GrpE [Tautonia plasticadhaerens]QDV33631.1 heat shock protein GrpE [Tautonia plasticadhaerens]